MPCKKTLTTPTPNTLNNPSEVTTWYPGKSVTSGNITESSLYLQKCQNYEIQIRNLFLCIYACLGVSLCGSGYPYCDLSLINIFLMSLTLPILPLFLLVKSCSKSTGVISSVLLFNGHWLPKSFMSSYLDTLLQ